MADNAVTSGQAGADSTGTTVAAPAGQTSSSVSTGQTTGNGSDAGASESFFDPSTIQDKPELLTAYKQMQGSYTKRMQGLREHQQKIDAYDKFSASPLDTLKQLAAQYGYNFVQRDGEAPKDWNPQSWDEVMARAKDEVRKDFAPVLSEVKQLKQKNIEAHLDASHPDWRTYEDAMMKTLKTHPSMVNDPDSLYRLSVPSEVLEARATAKAMQKLRSTGDSAQVSGPSTTNKPTSQKPTGRLSFDQAVQAARAELSKRGLKRVADH